ncbi:RNA-binding (RRM/RBD/RNP motifs) family protein [Klebsormidium nitens]|uniref:RNA-binding (RRM/RBD/RNP motifs) family protein n=1 Tax=Klebsormidium nitens TaxID=105231 RepID=A0A1Y1I0G8_KLENI|nr:RNA-binding (RRM/RBD/RNP motifs) family protein [Klebsormidium nitens]|eukprot:GAQ81598.1 RNA-binding (RRM/RBD/RNP motifs) family protein [Klebsormidium nitens]
MASTAVQGNGGLSGAISPNGTKTRAGNRTSGGAEKDADSPRLFVGQIGNKPNEAELKQLFDNIGEVVQFQVLRDKKTKQTKGCCFVAYRTRADAEKAIASLHEKHTIAPNRKPLVVQYAAGELDRIENKLFVGSLPRELDEAALRALFSQFGTVKEISAPRQPGGQSKGFGFVKMSVKEEAAKAIEGLNEKHTMPGQKKPLVVKWADTEEGRAQRMAAKQGAPFGSPMQGPMQGGFPMGPNMGMGMGMGGPMGGPMGGFSPMRPQGGPFIQQPGMNFSPQQQQQLPQQMGGGPSPVMANFGTMASQGFMGLPSNSPPLAFNARPGLLSGPGSSMLGSFGVNQMQPQQQAPQQALPQPTQTQAGISSPSPAQAAPGPQGTMSPAFVTRVPGPTPPTGLPATASAAQVAATVAGTALGTPGASLFVYHLPTEFRDNDLMTTFSPFGNLVNAKVFIDQNTGESKGFGTVSFDTPEAAEAAASVLDGFALGGKTLKVQVKKEAPKPY